MADEKDDKAKPEASSEDKLAQAAIEKQDNSKRPPIDPKQAVMAVKVYAPFKIYYEGDAISLTALNETGTFDILPHHHNFLTMLLPCDLVIHTPYDTQTVRISRALMHVKADKVTVYLDV